MSGSFLSSYRKVDHFIDDLTFLALNGKSLQHPAEVFALVFNSIILIERGILERLV